jgi:hypothetical protein
MNLGDNPLAEEYRAASHDWQKKWKAADDELQKAKQEIVSLQTKLKEAGELIALAKTILLFYT